MLLMLRIGKQQTHGHERVFRRFAWCTGDLQHNASAANYYDS